jgi:hypothetical protein
MQKRVLVKGSCSISLCLCQPEVHLFDMHMSPSKQNKAIRQSGRQLIRQVVEASRISMPHKYSHPPFCHSKGEKEVVCRPQRPSPLIFILSLAPAESPLTLSFGKFRIWASGERERERTRTLGIRYIAAHHHAF